MNAAALRGWIAGALGEAAVAAHFAALSTNLKAVAAFGIRARARVRLSRLGRRALFAVVAGRAGHSAHGRLGRNSRRCSTAPGRWTSISATRRCARNLPVLLGLVGVWHVNALGCAAHCVLAYDERLRRLPAHLQQVEMESNGKHIGLDGAPLDHDTCPVLFGEPGTSAQHSFMQLVHQGTAHDPGGLHPRRRARPRPAGRAIARSPPTPSPRPRHCCAAAPRLRANPGATSPANAPATPSCSANSTPSAWAG